MDTYIERTHRAMTQPVLSQPLSASWGMGSHIVHSVEVKVGQNWADMEKVNV